MSRLLTPELGDALEHHACEVARLARLTSRALGVGAAEIDRIELAAAAAPLARAM